MGIELVNIGDNSIQVVGTHNGIRVTGWAHKVKVPGNQKKVWQYALSLMYDGKLVTVKSNENEGTMTREDLLLTRILQVCEKEKPQEIVKFSQSLIDKCTDALRMFYALPPYHGGSNICAHDSYFAADMRKKYPPKLIEQCEERLKKKYPEFMR